HYPRLQPPNPRQLHEATGHACSPQHTTQTPTAYTHEAQKKQCLLVLIYGFLHTSYIILNASYNPYIIVTIPTKTAPAARNNTPTPLPQSMKLSMDGDRVLLETLLRYALCF